MALGNPNGGIFRDFRGTGANIFILVKMTLYEVLYRGINLCQCGTLHGGFSIRLPGESMGMISVAMSWTLPHRVHCGTGDPEVVCASSARMDLAL